MKIIDFLKRLFFANYFVYFEIIKDNRVVINGDIFITAPSWRLATSAFYKGLEEYLLNPSNIFLKGKEIDLTCATLRIVRVNRL